MAFVRDFRVLRITFAPISPPKLTYNLLVRLELNLNSVKGLVRPRVIEWVECRRWLYLIYRYIPGWKILAEKHILYAVLRSCVVWSVYSPVFVKGETVWTGWTLVWSIRFVINNDHLASSIIIMIMFVLGGFQELNFRKGRGKKLYVLDGFRFIWFTRNKTVKLTPLCSTV